MVTIIFTSEAGSYRMFESRTYVSALRTYLYQSGNEKGKIILIYDLVERKAIYKAPSYNEHHRNIRNKFFSKILLAKDDLVAKS